MVQASPLPEQPFSRLSIMQVALEGETMVSLNSASIKPTSSFARAPHFTFHLLYPLRFLSLFPSFLLRLLCASLLFPHVQEASGLAFSLLTLLAATHEPRTFPIQHVAHVAFNPSRFPIPHDFSLGCARLFSQSQLHQLCFGCCFKCYWLCPNYRKWCQFQCYQWPRWSSRYCLVRWLAR